MEALGSLSVVGRGVRSDIICSGELAFEFQNVYLEVARVKLGVALPTCIPKGLQYVGRGAQIETGVNRVPTLGANQFVSQNAESSKIHIKSLAENL